MLTFHFCFSITSYQTLPRNMPSHRTQVVPRYPEGYRTLPRNMLRPDSISSVAGSVYDCALQPVAAEKRRSMRDDTLWQLYEWQQRQAYSRMGYSTLPSPKTLSHIAESIPSSPSHGSLALYQSVSPNRPYDPSTGSEVSSPVFRGDASLNRRHRAHLAKVDADLNSSYRTLILIALSLWPFVFFLTGFLLFSVLCSLSVCVPTRLQGPSSSERHAAVPAGENGMLLLLSAFVLLY